MSHFTVLCIGDNPEEQLKPFDESLQKDFEDCTEEANKSWEEATLKEWDADVEATITKEDYENFERDGKLELTDFPSNSFRGHKFVDGNRLKVNYEFPTDIWLNTEHPRWSEYLYATISNVKKEEKLHPSKITYALIEKIESPKDIPVKEKYESFESFLKDYHGYVINGELIGYWQNKTAKWDWYQLGGRLTGMLKLKKGAKGKVGEPGVSTESSPSGYVDSAKKCDIDFESMSQEAVKTSTERYENFLEKYNLDKECKTFHPQFDFAVKGQVVDGIFIPESKETHVKRHSGFVTFAILKDGQWFERGEMGWWGIAHNEKPDEAWDEEFSKLLDELPDNTLLSVYDCHI